MRQLYTLPLPTPERMETKSLKRYALLTEGVLLAGNFYRINLSAIDNLLKTDEAGSPIDLSNDVPEKEHATKARSAIVIEPLNSVGMPVERYSKYK